jgi:predicted RNase H-related nuclease YkuK (DUF458 family)
MENFEFKKFGGDAILDLGQYLRDYLSLYPNTTVYVGTDSQNAGATTRYVSVVCLYDEVRKDGVHYILALRNEKREKDVFSRMWREVTFSLEIADHLETQLEGHIKRLSAEEILAIQKKELQKPLYERDPSLAEFGTYQNKLVNIDLDINPDFGEGRNKSNVAYVASKSYLTGLGYRVRFKPFAWSASVAADFRVKTKRRPRKHRR